MSEPATVTPVTAVAVRRSSAPGPLDIVQAALKSGSVEIYKEAVALYKDLQSMEARKAFDNAMADAVFPIIKKNRAVDFTSAKGRTFYKHEDLAEVLRTVVPILAQHGLSHRYRVTSNINEPVTVTCIISHRDGYFEETTLCAGKDDTGGKNLIQQVASTVTYLQRITLKAALGLAASEDDDGRASEAGAVSDEVLTDAEVAHIRSLLEKTGCPERNFLIAAKRDRIEDIPNVNYDRCVALINSYKGPRS